MSEQGNGLGEAPGMQIVTQYIKDLSFENPGAPGGVTQRPQIDFSVDVQARRGEAEHFEVEMKIRANATAEGKPLFLLELVYAGLFRLHNIPEEAIQQVLLIEGPHMLFPFARRIVADVVRDGGMMPLMIEPLDFAAIFRAKMLEAQQGIAQAPGVA